MAIRKVKISLDQWDIQSELVFEVNDDVFTEKLAAEINNFWSGDEDRLEKSDASVIDAALKLYAAECFQLVAFNNFYDEEYVTKKFDWSRGEGVEGFPSSVFFKIVVTLCLNIKLHLLRLLLVPYLG